MNNVTHVRSAHWELTFVKHFLMRLSMIQYTNHVHMYQRHEQVTLIAYSSAQDVPGSAFTQLTLTRITAMTTKKFAQ